MINQINDIIKHKHSMKYVNCKSFSVPIQSYITVLMKEHKRLIYCKSWLPVKKFLINASPFTFYCIYQESFYKSFRKRVPLSRWELTSGLCARPVMPVIMTGEIVKWQVRLRNFSSNQLCFHQNWHFFFKSAIF